MADRKRQRLDGPRPPCCAECAHEETRRAEVFVEVQRSRIARLLPEVRVMRLDGSEGTLSLADDFDDDVERAAAFLVEEVAPVAELVYWQSRHAPLPCEMYRLAAEDDGLSRDKMSQAVAALDLLVAYRAFLTEHYPGWRGVLRRHEITHSP